MFNTAAASMIALWSAVVPNAQEMSIKTAINAMLLPIARRPVIQARFCLHLGAGFAPDISNVMCKGVTRVEAQCRRG